MRPIILHYHLFKNAGTSLDHILRQNFAQAWVTAEFPASDNNNTDQVAAWIADTPDAIAYSSHTMLGPIPRVVGVQVIPVMLLRDPLARIRSAYQFERNQIADTWGAQLAKDHDFEGYVRARLAREGDRQCRNFQTARLASLIPGEDAELERAIAAAHLIQQNGVLGRVEDFTGALVTLTQRIRPAFPTFQADAVRTNVSIKPVTGSDETVTSLLTEANMDDLAVLNAMKISTCAV